MTDLITFLDNNRKSSVYKGVNIHVLYRYLKMIVDTTTLTTSGQRSHNFCTSSSINNDTEYLYIVIVDLHMRQITIYECCGRIGNKDYSCIIRGPKFLLPSLRRKMNQFNDIHGEEPNDPPRDWNRQTPADHFKSITSPPKISPVVSAIMGRLNNYAIDNGDFEVHP